MAPTTYGDLGKSARDVFGKGYHFSLMKLELKTKTASGVDFTAGKNIRRKLCWKKMRFLDFCSVTFKSCFNHPFFD